MSALDDRLAARCGPELLRQVEAAGPQSAAIRALCIIGLVASGADPRPLLAEAASAAGRLAPGPVLDTLLAVMRGESPQLCSTNVQHSFDVAEPSDSPPAELTDGWDV